MCGFLIDTQGDLTKEQFTQALKVIEHRGPDNQQVHELKNGAKFGFNRLAIMDPSPVGNQPFTDQTQGNIVVCNGEIYNEQKLKEQLKNAYDFQSTSDCEVLLPLYNEVGLEKLCQSLDAEFAFCLYDQEKDSFFAARDSIGIRPLFYGHTKNKGILFCSEAKSLLPYCEKVYPFPPGHYYNGKDFVEFKDLTKTTKDFIESKEVALSGIQELLVEGVRKRLTSDVPVGFLLSGGLDSSLVCAIAAKELNNSIHTFSVGIDENPIDTKYAKIVADYIGSEHHEVLFSFEEVLKALDDVIFKLETFDITTVRASIGMYLVCKYIHQKTDIKVLLTGEVSDELFGYKYTDFAPSPEEFQKESQKRVRELFYYDVLRADRCIAAHSLEARVPFGDHDFVTHVMHIDPKLKMNTNNIGKYLLRAAFQKGDWLPEEILMREKAAFSDAVGHSMVDYLKEYAENQHTQEDVEQAKKTYKHSPPHTKEALLYRKIFEKHYPNQSHLIPSFWMPNKEWDNCDVDDPSARALPNYGKSGN